MKSNFEAVSAWLEREGIPFTVDVSDNGRQVLVIADRYLFWPATRGWRLLAEGSAKRVGFSSLLDDYERYRKAFLLPPRKDPCED